MPLDLTFDDGPVMPLRLRSYQVAWSDAIDEDRKQFDRVLVDAPGGVGKSSLSASLAFREHTQRGGKTLVLENRDRLVEQIASEIARATGLEVDIEKAESHASPYAPIVVGSIQSLSRVNRLTGFDPKHFSLIIVDECHANTLGATSVRVLNWFHYGAQSLQEDWKPGPADKPHSFIVGTTATPDLGAKRTLGNFYQKISVRYSYAQACADGWLVEPRAYREQLPNAKKLRARYGNTPTGKDLRADDLSAELIPLVADCANQIQKFAQGCKVIAFGPSVEFARLLSIACEQRGFRSWFVSGECLDKDDKTDAFCASGPNSVLSNCSIYNAGWDHPPIDCVAWFRPTVSRAFLLQGLYRGSRTLPGLVSDDMTAEQRVAAIAGSLKPNFRIIDPLWNSKEIPLCSYYDLWTSNPEVKKKLEELPEGADMAEAAERGERDWEKALAKAAQKQKKREAEIGVDPLRWAMSLGADRIAHYEPKTDAEAGPMSDEQKDFFARAGIKYGHVQCYGQAKELIDTYLFRQTEKLASPKSLEQLTLRLGWPEHLATKMKQSQAGVLIAKGLRYKAPAA